MKATKEFFESLRKEISAIQNVQLSLLDLIADDGELDLSNDDQQCELTKLKAKIKAKDVEIENLKAQLQTRDRNDVRELLSWFVTISDKLDDDSVKGLIVALGKYNNDHAHAYTEEINALYEVLGKKCTPNVQGDLVMNKEVQCEVNGVAQGGTGVNINYK